MSCFSIDHPQLGPIKLHVGRTWCLCLALVWMTLFATGKPPISTAQEFPFDRDTLNEAGRRQMETHSVSWGDFDNDGNIDLFLSGDGVDNILYHNQGNAVFERLNAVELQISALSRGASWGDYDNDGQLDLFIVNDQGADNTLLRNQGDGSFRNVSLTAGIRAGGHSNSASWGDYDRDGLLDIFVANDFSVEEDNFVHRNLGDGSFRRVDRSIGIEGGFSDLGVWVDYDNDGDVDLFVSNIRNQQRNFLYANDGGGRFLHITSGALVSDEGRSAGSSWADYDNDGDLDVLVAFEGFGRSFIYRNDGESRFTRLDDNNSSHRLSDCLGSAWVDYDNDGDLDLCLVNRSIALLYRNDGGELQEIQFRDMTAGEGVRTATAWADYDNDGDMDVFIANSSARHASALYRNRGNDGAWVNIALSGLLSNRAAIGARVRARAFIDGRHVWQMRRVEGQSGYRSQNSLRVHFGLGDARLIDSLLIEWPSGIRQILTCMPVRRFYRIEEADTSITMGPPLLIDIGPDLRQICAGEELMLDAGGGFAHYEWSNGATSSSITVTEDGRFSVRVRDHSGCEHESNEVSVAVRPLPLPEILASTTALCGGQSAELRVEGDYAAYEWSNGFGGRSIVIDQAGDYFVTVRDDHGCLATSALVSIEGGGDLEVPAAIGDYPIMLDSTGIGGIRCSKIILRNPGAEEYILHDAHFRRNVEFSIPRHQLPLRIPPEDERELIVCFAPTAAEVYEDRLHLSGGSCGESSVSVIAVGIPTRLQGRAACNVPLSVTAQPGSALWLSSPYPNPVSVEVRIAIDLSYPVGAERPAVTGRLFDVLGLPGQQAEYRCVRKEIHGSQIREQGDLIFTCREIAAGMYWAAVRTTQDARVFSLRIVQ